MKLPSVYANKIDKVIRNNDEYFKGDRTTTKKDSVELKKYFDRNGYANKLSVMLTLKDGKRLEKLILCKDDYVININNQRIYFKDIIDYEIK